MPNPPLLDILIVDDEAPARTRLSILLDDIRPRVPNRVAGEAADGQAALDHLRAHRADVVLADIRMPGMDGLELAGHLSRLACPPAVIFTTAYDNYAVRAFELNAIDYLLKPVRAQRLATALEKARLAQRPGAETLAGIGREIRGAGRTHLPCHERGRLLLVPVSDVLYLKAELKYVTARTREREYLLDESLTRLEDEFAERFIRLHRSVLVARGALAGLEKPPDDDTEAYGWALVRDVAERLPISRRHWPLAKSFAVGRPPRLPEVKTPNDLESE